MVTDKQVYGCMAQTLERLCHRTGENQAKATLANLRRGVGRKPGDMPELWGILLQDLPEEMLSRGSEPSYAEWALYAALTLFALHSQGRDIQKEAMNQSGQSFGAAVRRLAHSDDDMERIRRRFNAVATSSDMTELTHHLRGMIQLLRADGIALDYPALAADLFNYQFPSRAPSVRLKWGQDFYRVKSNENESEETNHA